MSTTFYKLYDKCPYAVNSTKTEPTGEVFAESGGAAARMNSDFRENQSEWYKASSDAGGYATLRKEVVTMKKYILRIIFFTIVFLIVFTIKVK